MDLSPQNQIKPLAPYTIHIKSLYTYQSYLTKRPRHTNTFKFTRQGPPYKSDKENQIVTQIKLQKALHHLKSVRKADLSQLQVRGENLNQNRLQSCLKHISKISTLDWTRYQLCADLGANFAEKILKHLPKLSNLAYELSFLHLIGESDPLKGICKKDPLRYSRYSPKVRSLQIGAYHDNDYSLSTIFSGLQKPPASLKRLEVKLPNGEEDLGSGFFLEKLSQLEAVSFKFNGSVNEGYWAWKLDGLSQLSRFQEISLEFQKNFLPELDLLFKKLAQKKIMKRIRLIFPDSFIFQEEEKVLKALQEFDQLTHFELNIPIRDDEMLIALSKCLDNKKLLQHLSLTLSNRIAMQSFNTMKALCHQINDLQNLRHLHLSFSPMRATPDFILDWKFTAKLESLSLVYTQLYPLKSFLYLTEALKTSSSSLQKLKVFFGSFSPDAKSQELIIEFLSSLKNIQVLEMNGLDIEDDNFLLQILKAIVSFRYLRELALGSVKEGLTASVYETALERILTKRGLRRFGWDTCDSILQESGILGGFVITGLDVKRIEKKNPFLKDAQLSTDLFADNALNGVVYWP